MHEGKIKILYTIPNLDTAGSGIVIKKLVQNLNKDIFEPHVCCLRTGGNLFGEIQSLGVQMHVMKYVSPMGNKLKGLLGCWRVSRFFKQFDIVFSYHYTDDYSEGIAARMAGVKWIYVKKNMAWGGNGWKWRTRFAHKINVQNTEMAEHFFKGSDKIIHIPIGVDTDEFKPQLPAKHLLSEFNIPENSKIILTVANLVSVKGVEVLIHAFGKLLQEKSDIRLVVVGSDQTDYSNEIKKIASESPNSKNIIFTGKRSDIKDFHSIANIYVQPSWKEASPISLLEAMACGVLVLGSSTGGIKDQLADIPEQLFEPGNADELAAKIDRYIMIPETERLAIVQKQSDIVSKGYTLAREVEQHEDFYLQLMGKK